MVHTLNSLLKTRFAVSLLIVSILLMAAISEVAYRRAEATLTNGIKLTDARIGAAKLLQLLTDAETAQRGYLLTADPAYIEPLRLAQREFQSNSVFLDFIGGMDKQGLQDAQNIRRTVSSQFAELDRTIAMAQSGDRAQALAMVQSNAGKQLMDELRALFKTQLDRASALQQEARNRIYTALSFSRVAIFVLCCTLALGIFLHMRQVREVDEQRLRYQRTLETEVTEKTSEMRKLASWLDTAREDEKSHLARELHDELGSLLTAAKLTLARIRFKAAGDPKLSEDIENVSRHLSNGIALKRRIIEDLRPSSLSQLGLPAALEILCSESASSLGIPVTLDLGDVKIPGELELSVFRLVQEALTNIGKYAQASQVLVTLKQVNGHTCLTVTDDGVGFDVATLEVSRHGLAGMRFRMESHGGSLSIESAPQRGVTIVATLPLEPSDLAEPAVKVMPATA